jgi:RNA polymerase sigma-70 factor, ECF subfamily
LSCSSLEEDRPICKILTKYFNYRVKNLFNLALYFFRTAYTYADRTENHEFERILQKNVIKKDFIGSYIYMWDKKSRFVALVKAYSDDLYRFAYWLCHDNDHAEDLVQETMTRAWRALDNLHDDKAAKSWLFTTLRRENARRFERIQPNLVDIDTESIAYTVPDYDTSTEAFILRQSLANLAIEYREPLLLQVLVGYSCDEIAELLEISTGAVMTRLFRARQQLRESITGDKCQVAEVKAR